MTDLWAYDAWDSVGETGWTNGTVPTSEWDVDAHVDLGCGRVKKGRIGIDRYPDPGVNVIFDANAPEGPITTHISSAPNWDADTAYMPYRQTFVSPLPFPDNSIKSIISHHFFEHVGENFVKIVEECYRVLEPGGVLRAITPLFPSAAAVEDPDHRRYFMANTWNFCLGTPDHHWYESFATPYTTARFHEIEKDMSPAGPDVWSDAREIRTSLQAVK